ncbi:DUF4136 domain-containing protein [Sphingobacterium sp. HJSM2_6]|uniref:DUF4136 domain-containing protein n=1 Tax=Sphingobacterium sp. HJSM2_6 TaxID=3366264 RepID=UPI003BC94F7C
MNMRWSLLLVGIILFLGSCSTYKYNMTRVQELNFSQYKTYGWLPPVDSLSKSYFNNDIARENILSSANRELGARGLSYSKENPDIVFRYITIVNNKSRLVYSNPGWGWGGTWGWYRPWGYYGGPMYPQGREKYRYAHLIIEAVDTKTKTVIWQARGSGEVRSPEKSINDLPKIVKGIFEEYPKN